MSAEKVVTTCPVCGRHSLVVHCPTGRCGWLKCRTTTCDAVLDMTRRRGHHIDPDDASGMKRVQWAPP